MSNEKRFSYQKRSADAIKKRANQQGGSRDGIIKDKYKVYQVKDKDNRVRFLPPTWDNAEHYGLDVYVHYQVGPDNASYACLFKMKGEPCPICEERKRAEASKETDYAKELNATKRVLCWVIDRDNESDGPLLWAMPWTLDRDISKLSQDKRTGEVFEVDNPSEGYDVEFEKEGVKQQTKYAGIQLARRTTPLGNENWVSYVVENPVPDCIAYHSYEYIRDVFFGKETSVKEESQESGSSERSPETSHESSKEIPKEDLREAPIEKEQVEQAQDISYEELEKFSRADLEDLAVEFNFLKPSALRQLSDGDLLSTVAQKLGVSAPKKEETKKESYKEKLARLRGEAK